MPVGRVHMPPVGRVHMMQFRAAFVLMPGSAALTATAAGRDPVTGVDGAVTHA